jgi:putative ABC transport system permease protein
MNYFTALKLSGKNISTKKWRTALTAFASSIGIIGIALILSLSNGLQSHIDAFQENSLAEFPIMIMQNALNLNVAFGEDHEARMAALDEQHFTDAPYVYLFNPGDVEVLHTNIFTDAFIDHMEAIDPTVVSSIGYMRFTGMNLLRQVDGVVRTR